jgi:lysophospholipase L1-like esterase
VVVANASNSGGAITWVRSDSIVAESASGAVSLVSGDGNAIGLGAQSSSYRTVLFGDSMTSQLYVDTTNSASYAPSTGVLTITQSSHALATGWHVDVFNRTYTVLKKKQRLPITRIDANTFSVNIGANQPGLPDGALSGSTFARVESRQGSNSWVNWLQMLMRWPFDIVWNGAQSGDTTQDCLDRIEADCLDYEPKVVLMQIPGINDMSVGNGPIDEETIFTNQKTIINRILAINAFIVLCPLTPVFTGEGRATAQNMARVARLNRRLAQFVQGKTGVAMIDAYGLTVNPTSATGLAVADYVKSTDYIHYSVPGALRVGKAARDKLQYLFATDFDTRPRATIDSFTPGAVTASSVTISGGVATFNSTAHGFLAGETVGVFGATATGTLDGWVTILSRTADAFTFATSASGTVTGTVVASRSRNVFDNCVLATTTGGTVTAPVTGTCGDGFNARFHSGSGTAAASVVAQADGFGNAQRLVIGAAVANDLIGFQSEVTSTLNRYAQVGETYFMEGDLRIASANWANTPITEIMFRLIATVDGTLFSAHAINTYDGLTGVSVAEDLALHVRTPKLTIPAGTLTAFYWQVYVRASGTVSSNLTLDLSRVAVQRVDP